MICPSIRYGRRSPEWIPRIIRLIAERQHLAEKIARIKITKGMAIHDQDRTEKVLESVFDQAVE